MPEVLRDPRRAIREWEIVCLICGLAFRHLTDTHLARRGLTVLGYKRRFGCSTFDVPGPVYAERAVRIGLADRTDGRSWRILRCGEPERGVRSRWRRS